MQHLYILRRTFLLLAALADSVLFTVQTACAHSGKARFHLVIDTDGAADDLRTLLLLLGNREAEVLALVTSEGALLPAETALKADALCADLYHEGIAVGPGRSTDDKRPAWGLHSSQVIWGERGTPTSEFPSATALLTATLENEEEPVVYVALGALTNLYNLLLSHEELKKDISRVVWYNTSATMAAGANYEADPKAAKWVLECGIPIDVVAATPDHPLKITHRLIDSIATVQTPYARKIVATHRRPPLDRLIGEGHLEAWDDLVAVYLYAPQLFDSQRISDSVTFCPLKADAHEKAQEEMLRILKGKPDAETRVFFGFPTAAELYADDVQSVMTETLSRYGESEWRAGVLTNELHGHLGIYATVGVKMGIRAREYFNIGVDDITITSYAGSHPPISCMNDGLQVAAGSTVGHGLLRVAPTDTPRPMADFTFRGKTLRLALKAEYADRISRDVKHGIEQYGFGTEPYWQYVRGLAIGYWRTFDRHEIFEMTLLN